MTQQQSYAAAQRRRNIATAGLFGAILVGAGLAAFSGPSSKEIAPEPPKAPVQAVAAQPAPAEKPKRERKKRTKKERKPVQAEMKWTDPPEWKRLSSSGMRFASYEIPAAKGDTRIGELNVFILTGDIESNIQRWVGEFSKFDLKTVVRKDRKVNGLDQHLVEIPSGHFNGGMGDTKESDNYGLLGAIVVAKSGSKYFFKLTGPAKVVKGARKSFYSMLDSMEPVELPPKPAEAAAGADPEGESEPAAPAPATAAPAGVGGASPAPAPAAGGAAPH